MKRILRAGVLGTAVSMLFTGCGSSGLVSGLGNGYEEIRWQYVETQENRLNLGQTGLDTKTGETLPAKELPDLYVEEEDEKFKELEGKQAFKIKDGHSTDSQDIESFEIGTLQSDGTFIYCYSTKVGTLAENATVDNRQMVHCMAAYNYKTEQFKVIHEKPFTRTVTKTADGKEEIDYEKEAFYMQMCSSDGTGDMFVYDRGRGYVYGADGTLKFETDIETFVSMHFKGTITSTEAYMDTTSDSTRIYVDLVIEKQVIAVPEDDGEEISEEDADAEAEKLDKEIADKTIEAVLVYDFREYTSTIDQNNTKLDSQINAWKTFRPYFAYENWVPDAEDDWNAVVASMPDEWGPAFLWSGAKWTKEEREAYGVYDDYMKGTPVFQWSGGKKFGYNEDGYTSNFIPEDGSYKPFTDLKANMELEDVFVFIDGKYYELFGTVVNDIDKATYADETFSRIVRRYNNPHNEAEGIQKYDEFKQTLTKNRQRDANPENCYLEGYWIQDYFHSVFDVVDGTVYGMRNYVSKGEDDDSDDTEYDLLMTLSDEGYIDIKAYLPVETMVDVFKDGDTTYMALALDECTEIYNMDGAWPVLCQEIPKTAFSNMLEEVEYMSADVDSTYHDAYDSMRKGETDAKADQSAGEHLDGNNMLRVSLSEPHKDLLQKIEDYKLEEFDKNYEEELAASNSIETALDVLEMKQERAKLAEISSIAEDDGEGYLITTLANGLVYYDINTELAVNVAEGTWYRTWKLGDEGNQFVAVGFGKNSSTYGTLDVAYARAVEFNLDEKYKTSLDSIVASIDKALSYKQEPESEGAREMREQYEEERVDESIVFVEPSEADWQNNTPGSEIERIEAERQQNEENIKASKEAAGEWRDVDQYAYDLKKEE